MIKNKIHYKVLARYPNDNKDKEWGDWQVGTFARKQDAIDYMVRTTERYGTKEPKYHLEMKLENISWEQAKEFNHKLNSMLD